MLTTVLFGSIGSVVESSRLQRLAYNAAFEKFELNIYWNVATYCKLLEIPGGLRRLESLYGDVWQPGLTEEIHAEKERQFETLALEGLTPRPGIVDTLALCHKHNIRVGWVTTATPKMLATLSDAMGSDLSLSDFDFVTDKTSVQEEKPSPEVYHQVIAEQHLNTERVVAFEDTRVNQTAALTANLTCYLYPGEYAAVDSTVLVCRNPLDVVAKEYELQQMARENVVTR